MRQMMESAGSLGGSVSPWLLKLRVHGVLKPWSLCHVWPLA